MYDSYPHVRSSADSSVHETRHRYISYPAKTVTKLKGPTLFLCLDCFCPQPTSISDISLHAANKCVHNHNAAQLDKDLRCEYLWYKP